MEGFDRKKTCTVESAQPGQTLLVGLFRWRAASRVRPCWADSTVGTMKKKEKLKSAERPHCTLENASYHLVLRALCTSGFCCDNVHHVQMCVPTIRTFADQAHLNTSEGNGEVIEHEIT